MKQNYTWEQFDKDSEKLAKKIKAIPEVIIAITRGGGLISVKLSYKLNIKVIETIGVESYEGSHRNKIKLIKGCSKKYIKNKDVLIVDDLVDSGETMTFVYAEILELNPNTLQTATLFIKPTSKFIPDYFVRKTNQWIVFPWEQKI